MNVPSVQDFELIFESQGTTFLFEDVVDRYYNFSGSVSIFKEGKKSVYLSKEAYARLGEEGVRLSVSELRGIVKRLEETTAKALKERSAYSEKVGYTRSDAEYMLSQLAAICSDYAWFDFSYWDPTFRQAEAGDGAAQEKVDIVQGFKNRIRADFEPVFWGPLSYLWIFARRAAEANGETLENVLWYRCEEVIDLFEGKKVEQEELARRRDYVFDQSAGERTFYSGVEAWNFAETFLAGQHQNGPSDNIIKGKTAHKTGKLIEGKVRVLLRDYENREKLTEDMDAMEEGEILVSQTTDPELMPALRKASALVTDIGGMLSHSAIVSRELNIPCIIDTKNASKILKTGDMVEVDAERGIVRILS